MLGDIAVVVPAFRAVRGRSFPTLAVADCSTGRTIFRPVRSVLFTRRFFFIFKKMKCVSSESESVHHKGPFGGRQTRDK